MHPMIAEQLVAQIVEQRLRDAEERTALRRHGSGGRPYLGACAAVGRMLVLAGQWLIARSARSAPAAPAAWGADTTLWPRFGAGSTVSPAGRGSVSRR
jgi:hypothetical protein